MTRVVLHRVALDAPTDLDSLRGYLSDDERARAERLVFEEHRRRFVVARAALRRIVGDAQGLPPAAVRFDYGPKGKPRVAGIEVNLSHSHDQALVAVSDGAEVGVDIERCRPLKRRDAVARRSFSEWEYARYLEATGAEQEAVFFACWARKEAVIKALGLGIAYPLRSFDVEVRPGAAARVRRFDDPEEDPGRWTLAALDAPEGFAAAVAVRAPEAEVTLVDAGY